MALTDATPTAPETFKSVQLDGTLAQITTDVLPELEKALDSDHVVHYSIDGSCLDGSKEYTIRLFGPLGADGYAGTKGAWFVVSSLGAIRTLTDAEYQAEFGAHAA